MTLSRRLGMASLALLVAAPLVFGCAQRVSPQTDDNTIRVRVTTALLNDPEVKGSDINVGVTGGVVTLSGRVASKEEEQQALSVARRISGVREVQSKLQVN